MNHCINKLLNKLIIQNDLNFMVPKMKLTFGSPYLPNTSLEIRTTLRQTNERDSPYCKLKAIFRTSVDLTPRFHLKIHLRKKFALE